jgi:hypothetical protein
MEKKVNDQIRFSQLVRFLTSGVLLATVLSASAASLPPLEQAAQGGEKTPSPAANPSDVASIDSIVRALYDVISGPSGKKRDWDRMRSLFIPGARMIPTGKRQTGEISSRVMTVEDYITGNSKFLEENGFFEKEVARRAENFGNISHVFSTYESRHKAEDAKPFARGINSIQLMNDGKRWWIVTVFWQGEGPDNPLPEKYLAK